MQIQQHMRKYTGLTPSQESALTGALFIVAVIAVGAWMLRPHVAFLQASQRYEHAMGEHEEMSEVLNGDLADQRVTLNRLRDQRGGFARMAFSPAEAQQFHSDLQGVCREAGCEVTSLSYGREENVATYGDRDATSTMALHRTTLTLQGLYSSVLEVLEALQARPQRIWIEGFHMEMLPSKPGWVACDMRVVICVDYQKEHQ